MIFFLIVLGDQCAKFPKRLFGAVVGAGLAVLLGADGIQAFVKCHDNIPEVHSTERGFFVDPARKTALSLRSVLCDSLEPDDTERYLCEEQAAACGLQHEDGPIARASFFDYASTHGVCRDPVTGLDHVLIHFTSGSYLEVQFWSVNPASGGMKQEYEEAWYDYQDDFNIPYRHLLVDAAGRCLWRERQQGRAVFRRALSALRVGQDATPLLLQDDATALPVPVREIPTEVVRQHLLALDAMQPRMVEFGGAVYADEAGRVAWRVIQMTGTVVNDAGGVVLVEDRRTGTWRALYDVTSSWRRGNDPLEYMVVTGNTLTATLSAESGIGCFDIDLPTNRVTSRDGSVCVEMGELHYPSVCVEMGELHPSGYECGPEGEEKLFDLRKELGTD